MATADSFSLFWPSWHFLHGPFIVGTPSSGYLFKTQAQKTRNQGKEKLRGMLKITDWGFSWFSFTTEPAFVSCERAKFWHPEHELKTTYTFMVQLFIDFVLFIISLLSWALTYTYFRPVHNLSLKWRTENRSMQTFFQVYKNNEYMPLKWKNLIIKAL